MTSSSDAASLSGKLIVFEGIDGTGKSTQISLLKKVLDAMGKETVQSYEPTHGIWGKILRDSALTGRLPIEEEVDLFLKDRKDHVDRVILPGLREGKWILLDRYYLSMMAYQGARGQDVNVIRRLNEEFAPLPDLVLWLDIPVSLALERIGGRGASDSFEAEDMLTKCRDVFQQVNEPWMVRIDAAGSPEEVGRLVLEALKDKLFIP